MSQEWYYARGGQRLGPLAAENLKELAVSGRLQGDDLVWTAGMAEWAEARRIDWLSDVPAPPPIPIMPERQRDRRDYDFGVTLRTRNCTLAYVSLALVCLSLVTGGVLLLPGLVCGHMALAQCKRDPNMTGKAFAVAAVTVAYVIVGVAALIIVGLMGLLCLH